MASFLDTLFGGGAEKDAANANRALLANYQTQGQTALSNANATSNADYDAALRNWQGLQGKYGAATALGLDSLGVNGAAGNANAVSKFQAGPGYDFAVKQAEDAIARRQATSGMYNSGNTDLTLNGAVQGLANQEYGNWQNKLLGFVNPEMQAAQGVSTGYGNLANNANQYGSDLVGLTGNVTSGNMAANNAEAAGKAAGAKNLLGAGLSLASLAAGGIGGGGLGTALSSLNPMKSLPGGASRFSIG